MFNPKHSGDSPLMRLVSCVRLMLARNETLQYTPPVTNGVYCKVFLWVKIMNKLHKVKQLSEVTVSGALGRLAKMLGGKQ